MQLTAARRVLALPARQQALLLLAAGLVATVRASLWLLPARLSLSIVRQIAEQRGRRTILIGRPTLAQIAWAVDVVSRFVPRATCLTRAVSAQLLLRRYGYASRLCIGVARPSDGAFTAHAWVEVNGRVLVGGQQSAGFTVLRATSASRTSQSGAVRP